MLHSLPYINLRTMKTQYNANKSIKQTLSFSKKTHANKIINEQNRIYPDHFISGLNKLVRAIPSKTGSAVAEILNFLRSISKRVPVKLKQSAVLRCEIYSKRGDRHGPMLHAIVPKSTAKYRPMREWFCSRWCKTKSEI